MTVSAADLDEMQRLAATAPETDSAAMAALQSAEEVIGYVIEVARSEDRDEVDDVELLIRLAAMPPAEVRRVAHVLGQLGYRDVSAMLRKLAGRRRHSLAPIETADTTPTHQAQ